MVITFGEIMVRISPSDKGELLNQATIFRIEPGGSESNVAIALQNLGIETEFITKLPTNALSEKVILYLNQFNIVTNRILFGGDRLGVYWTENGSGPRNSNVLYDRAKSSFSEISPDEINWDRILEKSEWFHFSGISPAVSKNVFEVLKNLVDKIETPYSVDLNYREKLWDWTKNDKLTINDVMTRLCSKATLIAGNESDFQNVFNLSSSATVKDEMFREIAVKVFDKFPHAKFISISNRDSISASTNIWGGSLFVRNDEVFQYTGIKYTLESIIDRIGTGDSFVAGIIYGLLRFDRLSYKNAIDFACTLSALNHSIIGDASRFSAKDVFRVIENKGSGRIIR